MKFYKNNLYLEDLNYLSSLNIPWEKINNKTFLISGATGLIGSLLIDVLMKRNIDYHSNCRIYALGRNRDKAEKRFSNWINDSLFTFLTCDVNNPLDFNEINKVDFVLHLASNTHPMLYSTDPIGTILTNIVGTKNMLDFAVEQNAERFIFSSSNEIYGENRGDVEEFEEDYCGYINCNTLRAGYTESKRCGEALCQAYIKQKKLDIVIPRLTRSYGPTLLNSDTKALSQFLQKAINKEDIVLKSKGTQYFSYLHATDTVSGLLTVMLKGETGEAYNICDEGSNIHLKDLAKLVADCVNKKVIFDIPDSVEAAGYSKATKAILNNSKLKSLGWNAKYDIKSGIKQTLDIILMD